MSFFLVYVLGITTLEYHSEVSVGREAMIFCNPKFWGGGGGEGGWMVTDNEVSC